MSSLVSVIIPVYNRQGYIEECVRSVFAQSHQNIEILLVDDGSTDQSVSICEGLAREDARVRLVESAHGGVSAARNKGLDLAQGEYVFFLDSDDVIHPRLIEALADGLSSSGAAMAGSHVINVWEKNWHR